MAKKRKEEWQSTDSGYLNCIGMGDSYVRKQMERIMNNSLMDCSATFWGSVVCYNEESRIKK